MRATIKFAALIVTSLALPAVASEGVDLSIRSKSYSVTTEAPSKNAEAPFRHARDPLPELVLRDEEERRGPAGACENGNASVCYDAVSGKVVYRGAREYMPKVNGLTPESVSLRRGRLTLKYSF